MGDITLHPDSEQATGLINGNKGLIISVLLVIGALIVGLFSFINSTSSSKFQGMIQKVQVENQNLQKK